MKIKLASALAVIALGSLPAHAQQAGDPTFAFPATPPGVVLQLTTAKPFSGDPRSVYYADAAGRALYTFDNDKMGDKPACTGECAALWPPLKAAPAAKPTGPWTIVSRDDGVRQWAVRGKPLYTYAKDAKPGEVTGNNLGEVWRLAVANPAADITFPFDISSGELINGIGYGLATARGMTLYVFGRDSAGQAPACVKDCVATWRPYEAAAIANPVGDFSVIQRNDGMKQWAYKGKSLYTFTGDTQPRDAHGVGVDKAWQPALLARYFLPPNMVIKDDLRHGPMLFMADGKPLYAHDAVGFTGGGTAHTDRTVTRGDPSTGLKLGFTCDATCERTWRPVVATAESLPSGYWSVLKRADGQSQWAYRNFPLYTFAGDKTPDLAEGHDTFDITDGNNALYWRVALP